MKIKKNGKVINLTEGDLKRIVKKVLNENNPTNTIVKSVSKGVNHIQVKREIKDVLTQLQNKSKDEDLWSTFAYVISEVLEEDYDIESKNLDTTIDVVATILSSGVSKVSELGFFNGYGDFVTENKDTILEKLKESKQEVKDILGLDSLPPPY